MSDENSKIHEIKRLTTPITFKNSKAYDSDGVRVKCIESLSDIRYIIEPKPGILTDDEVLQYAPDSSYASKIKLQRGLGDASDFLLANNSIIGLLGVYYIALICILVPFAFWGNKTVMFLILILFVVPLLYLYKQSNSKGYANAEPKKQRQKVTSQSESSDSTQIRKGIGLESLKKYEKEVDNLKVLFDVKEEVVKDLIEKCFTPPQLTYDRFMSVIESSHKLFYAQSDSALNIINLAAEDTPRIEGELESKINNMKTIINQIEDLTNELVINLNSNDEKTEEVKNLLDEMENLISSVKEY
ncbi:MAG: hypothetical protein IKH85_05360 [Methanobrevibacter sp.]|uniref:hypothetical protein n=1 Tax=Methanobrevibacter sp. TaxID=66852 RepID=UPI0025CFC342|nr:hypothetical protein [Methanobrevibacter sp.]MBR6993490.1 hypothetical protein [Methanobrevibacter sp.]